MISIESEVYASSFFIHVSSGAAVQSKGWKRVFEKPVEKMRAKRRKVSTVDGPRESERWLCIEKRLWLGIVFRFGLFRWVSGIRSAGFTFVNCTTYVTRIIGSPSGEPMFSLCRKWRKFAGHCKVT